MRHKMLLIYALVFTVTLFFMFTTTVSAININHCGTLDTPGIYILTSNVSTNDTMCFTITAADVVLDCNGFNININNIFDKVNVHSDKPNTTIKNCNTTVPTSEKNIADTKALFDIVSEIASEPKKSGDLIVKVSLINFGALTTIDANLFYTISDSNGKIVRQYTKIVPVTTQLEFLEHINTTGMKNGKYILKIVLTYVGQTFPASTEKTFYVGGELLRGILTNLNANLKTYALSIVTTALLVGAYIKHRINKS